MLFAGLRKKKSIPIVCAELPIDEVIGNSFQHDKQFYAHCDIFARFGPEHTTHIPKGYHWNGADIPRMAWTLIGLSPTDRRSIIASGFHDRGCESPFIPQVLADATFVALLRPIRFNNHKLRGVGWMRATLMYMAVRSYSIFCRPLLQWLRGDK